MDIRIAFAALRDRIHERLFSGENLTKAVLAALDDIDRQAVEMRRSTDDQKSDEQELKR
jgi:hypothetical protein